MHPTDLIRIWYRIRKRKTIGFSIDITNRCNLKCSPCYMKWYEKKNDLPIQEWERIILSYPRQERLLCAWTGGEPMLRVEAIKKLVHCFRWNWIATNGTLPVPHLPKTTIFVSVDGNKRTHLSLRGGGWNELQQNMRENHYIHFNITKLNCSGPVLEETLSFWRGKARGVIFSFSTPNKKKRDDLYLTPSERRIVGKNLRSLKRKFGNYILNSERQLKLCAETPWADNCPASCLVALDSRGQVKRPCVLGSDVDCYQCGCAVPSFMYLAEKLHPATAVQLLRLFREGA